MRYVIGECFYYAAPDEAEERVTAGAALAATLGASTMLRLRGCMLKVSVHPAATEAAQEELQTLDSELEDLKGKMADLKKACAQNIHLYTAPCSTRFPHSRLTAALFHDAVLPAGALRQVWELDQPGLAARMHWLRTYASAVNKRC